MWVRFPSPANKNMTLPEINIDLILSDPMLMVGVCLVIVGPIVFLISLIQFLRMGKEHEAFVLPPHDNEQVFAPPVEETPPIELTPVPQENQQPEEVAITPEPVPVKKESMMPVGADKTIILPPGVSELQAQLEIALSQIKNLNKKVYELESSVEIVQKHADVKLNPDELKEPPMNAGEFTQKLLKVVEHVLVLEKEVAKLKLANSRQTTGTPNQTQKTPATTPNSPRPPILPL
jgi:hypothetical protein